MQTKPHSHTHAVETEGGVLNNMAPFYDKIVNLISLGKEKKIRKETIALAQIQPGEHVLDVGCGTGSLALAAAQRVGNAGKVAGIDPAPKMIEIAQRKAAKKGLQADFRVGVIEKLPYPDNSFDVVLSSLMMHHLPDHLKSDGIAETYRVLKPGGRLAIVDLDSSRFSLVNLVHGNTGGENRLARQFKHLMRENDFGNLTVKNMRYGSFTFVMGEKAS